MNSSIKIVLFKAENNQEKNDYQEFLEKRKFEIYSVSPIKFKFKNLNILMTRLSESNFFSNYSALVITSPRIIWILKHLIESMKLNIEFLRRIPCLTVGPQIQKALFKEFRINSLINNEHSNINNVKDLANYLIENENTIREKINSNKLLLYPTSDLSKRELTIYLNKSTFKVETFICYDTLPNENLDQELKSIFQKTISCDQSNTKSDQVFKNDDFKQKNNRMNEIIEKSFLFVFFSPSGVSSIKERVKCIKLDKIKSIAIGPTTKKSAEQHNFNLVATLEKPTPKALLETVLDYLKTT